MGQSESKSFSLDICFQTWVWGTQGILGAPQDSFIVTSHCNIVATKEIAHSHNLKVI